MLKKITVAVGLAFLLVLSFFFSNQVVSMVRKNDPIMIRLKEYKSYLDTKPVSAFLKEDTVIPGIYGCEVDVMTSYHLMSKTGKFVPSMIRYIEIEPHLSLKNIYYKYIEKANTKEHVLSVAILLNEINQNDTILKTLQALHLHANFFVDGFYLEQNADYIYKIIQGGHEVYNLGYHGTYDERYIDWTNSMIENISSNTSNYCITTSFDEEQLELCASHKMHTIKAPFLISEGTLISELISQIENGHILVFQSNPNSNQQIVDLIQYLTRKGYQFQLLSKHLNEKGC